MKKLIIVFIGIVFSLLSCTKEEIIYDNENSSLPPNVFFFQIVKNGSILQGDILDSLKMFYIKDRTKFYQHPNSNLTNRKFIEQAPEEYLQPYHVLMGLKTLNYIEDRYINEWFIEYPNGDIDTLYVETAEVSIEEGKKDRCYCVNPIKVLKFNGNNVTINPNIEGDMGKAVYVLEK